MDRMLEARLQAIAQELTGPRSLSDIERPASCFPFLRVRSRIHGQELSSFPAPWIPFFPPLIPCRPKALVGSGWSARASTRCGLYRSAPIHRGLGHGLATRTAGTRVPA